MTVLVIILICAPLLTFFLAAPIILSIDTETDDYCLRLGDMCSLRALAALENPGVRLRIGFWKKTWGVRQYLLTIGSKKGGSKQNRSSRNRLGWGGSGKGESSRNESKHRLLRVLKTFRVSKCDVLLDTDDFILNAQLFPVFQFCSGRWGHWRVNFEGDCRLQLEVESRLISVLYAWWWKT